MVLSLDEWTIQHEGAIFAAQRAKVDNLFIVIGLTLAVSATLVGTALQVDPVTVLDVLASISLGAALALSVVTIGHDRVTPCDRSRFTEEGLEDLDPDLCLKYISARLKAQAGYNNAYLREIQKWAVFQLITSVLTSVIAVISLVIGK